MAPYKQNSAKLKRNSNIRYKGNQITSKKYQAVGKLSEKEIIRSKLRHSSKCKKT